MRTYTLNNLLTARNLRCLLAPVRESLDPPDTKQKYVELLTTMMEGLSPETVAEKFQSTFMPTYINLLSINGYFGAARDKYELAAECTKSKILREAEFFARVAQVKQGREQQADSRLWLQGLDRRLIDDLLSSGCGLIVAMSKVGLMRDIALELALSGYSTMLAASKNVYPLWQQLFSEPAKPPLIELFNIENAAGVLAIVRGLRANRIVCINIEGETGVGGPWAQVHKHPVTFLSKQLVTRNGLVRLSLRTGAPILPIIAVRTGYQAGELVYGKPFEPRSSAAKDDATERTVIQKLFSFVEAIVIKHPSQYESFSNLHRLLPANERSSQGRREQGAAGVSSLSLSEASLRINYDRCVVIPHASGVYCVDPATMRAIRIPPDKTTVVDFLVQGSHVHDSCLQLPRDLQDRDAQYLAELVNNGMLKIASIGST